MNEPPPPAPRPLGPLYEVIDYNFARMQRLTLFQLLVVSVFPAPLELVVDHVDAFSFSSSSFSASLPSAKREGGVVLTFDLFTASY